MNKEEILEKSRKENSGSDEMELEIKDKSIKWTYLTMVIVAAIFAFIRDDQGLPIMDLCATVSLSVCAGQLYRFVKTKDRGCLLLAIITLIVSVFAIIRFFGGH